MNQNSDQVSSESEEEDASGDSRDSSSESVDEDIRSTPRATVSQPSSLTTYNIGAIHGSMHSGGTYTSYIKCSGTDADVISMHKAVVEEYSSGEESDTDKKTKVNADILNSSLSLSNDNRYIVAEGIGDLYKKMARLLPGARFKTSEISNIKLNNIHCAQEEVVYQILEKWHERAPNSATVGNLAKTLDGLGRADLANKLSLNTKHLNDED